MSVPLFSWPFVLLSLVAGSAADCAGCLNDNTAPDYTTLLSVRSTGIVHNTQKSDGSNTRQVDVGKPRQAAPGIVFVKMIKVAGELFSSLLSQYAFKRGWRALQHKDCSEDKNPLGQATCMCAKHYIGPDELPVSPKQEQRYAALYTHMHYVPDLLKDYMVPGALKLVILRHPLSVLRSTHAMAAVQALDEKHNIEDNFCQNLAADGDAWRAGCEFVQTGEDSLLDYLDHDANECLRLLLLERPRRDVHKEAMAIIEKVGQQLETFVVGLQEDFDGSMLLFEQAIGWSRDDTLYEKHDPNAHIYSKNAAAQAAVASWGFGTPRGEEIKTKLRRGAYFYHELLYQKGVEIHRKQMQERIGSNVVVESALLTYRAQLDVFTACLHSQRTQASDGTPRPVLGQPWNVCEYRGLVSFAKGRPECAEAAKR